jgi:hypothetical protein
MRIRLHPQPSASVVSVAVAAILGSSCTAQPAPPANSTRRPLVTPYAQRKSLHIGPLAAPAKGVPLYSRVELAVPLSATYDNPFDPEDIAVDAEIASPGRKRVTVPAFFHRAFTRALEGREERLTPAGEPRWLLRWTPTETGRHYIRVTARDRTGRATSAPIRVNVTRSASPGFIRLSRKDRRYFAFDNGRAYYPVGANVCWAGSRGTHDYDEWFPNYGKAGANYARLWLSPHWTTFALERPGKPEDGRGMGQFDLANAWRIDYVLDLAARNGLYLMLCIDSYNILNPSRQAYGVWADTPHNADNGGPLQQPTDFWTSAEMEQLYRAKLRYLVARYGASPHVLAWEFWNEVDLSQSYDSARTAAWHDRMARHLRALDPWKHLITTSLARTGGDPALDALPSLDYNQSHHYNSPDIAATVAEVGLTKRRYEKPHFFGEIGADAGGPRREEDTEGLQVHDPIWASLATAQSATAQPWWWDNLIAPRNLYGLFTPAARFAVDIDWPSEGMKPISPRLEWRDPPAVFPRADLLLENGPTSWERSEFNQPRTVRVTSEGASGQVPIAGIQHGLQNHRDKHNPVTFEVDLPQSTRFEVEVGDVSGHGGAALKITLDGRTVVEREFADPDGNTRTETLRQYAGRYGVEVPAGKHTVVVENTGPDWFMTSYRFANAVERRSPPLVAWASAGQRTALAWVRVEGRTWRRVVALKEQIPPAPASVVILPGLAPGRWTAEIWDTWTGRVLETQPVSVPASGEVRVILPPMGKDLAVKLRRSR